jgi:hypothetical protein
MQHLDRGGHLHSRRYIYVLEFQHRTEQAHFHVLIDATRVPKSDIDVAWSKLRPKTAGPVADNRPEFGMTRFSAPKFEGGALHAARYVTKYLVKSPPQGWPSWVMAMGGTKRVPRFQTSRGFWNRPRVVSEPSGQTRNLTPRSYGERVAECGTTTNIFATTERIDHQTGDVTQGRVWRARLDVELPAVAAAGEVKGKAGRCMVVRASGDAACIAALSAAAGLPIRVISGYGEARKAAKAAGGKP